MYTFEAVNGETVAYSLTQLSQEDQSSFLYYHVLTKDSEVIGTIRFTVGAKERQWCVPDLNKYLNLNVREQVVKMVFYNQYPRLMEA